MTSFSSMILNFFIKSAYCAVPRIISIKIAPT